MRLAGVELRDSAAAELVCLLQDNGQQALAFQLGHAIDHQHDQVALSPRDREAVFGVLSGCCPDGLADLRATLLADQINRV